MFPFSLSLVETIGWWIIAECMHMIIDQNSCIESNRRSVVISDVNITKIITHLFKNVNIIA